MKSVLKFVLKLVRGLLTLLSYLSMLAFGVGLLAIGMSCLALNEAPELFEDMVIPKMLIIGLAGAVLLVLSQGALKLAGGEPELLNGIFGLDL